MYFIPGGLLNRQGIIKLTTVFLAGVLILIAGSPLAVQAQSDPMETWEYVKPSTEFHFEVERFEANPIIHREMRGMVGKVGENINGPSLIRVPDWIENPLGKYYLYLLYSTAGEWAIAIAELHFHEE